MKYLNSHGERKRGSSEAHISGGRLKLLCVVVVGSVFGAPSSAETSEWETGPTRPSQISLKYTLKLTLLPVFTVTQFNWLWLILLEKASLLLSISAALLFVCGL